MSTTTTKLINPTDDELSAAVARIAPDASKRDFATSADAVLPLLEKFVWVDIGRDADYDGGPWHVALAIHRESEHGALFTAAEQTLPRAACIALLRANGIEVE